jgi:hypothetical protein
VSPENFNEIMEKNKQIAYQIATEYLRGLGAENIRILKEEYPYAIYDLEYTLAGKKCYLIVKHTATKSKYFSLPLSKIQFCKDFDGRAQVLLVTDVNGEPKIHNYTIDELNGLDKSINSITYEDRK